MGATLLAAILPLLQPVLDRVWPDPAERARQQAALTSQILNAIESADANQTNVNAEEAKSPHLFVAGWRPFIGWVCGAGCAWAFILEPITRMTLAAAGVAATLPAFDTNAMIGLLTGMLGLAGMRSFERFNGVIPPQTTAPSRR